MSRPTIDLPPGFGAAGPLPTAAADYRVKITKVVDEIVAAVFQNQVPRAAPGTKFTLHSNKDGLEVHTGRADGGGVDITVRANAVLPTSMTELENFVNGETSAEYSAWNSEMDPDMFLDCRVLARVEGRGYLFDETGLNIPARQRARLPCTAEIWFGYKFPFPLSNRDFMGAETCARIYVAEGGKGWRWAEAGSTPEAGETEYGFIATVSSERADCPAVPKFTRATVHIGAYFYTAAEGSTPDAPKTLLHGVMAVDMCGAVPDWLQNMIGPDQAQVAVNLRRHFAKRNELRAVLAPAVPAGLFQDEEKGVIPKSVKLNTSSTYSHAVRFTAAGDSIVLYAITEAKKVGVRVDLEDATTPLTFKLSNGEAFENGSKLQPGVILTATIGPVAGPSKAVINFVNSAKLTSKTVGFALDYVRSGGAAEAEAEAKAAATGGAGGK